MTKIMKRHLCLLLTVVMACVLLPLPGSAQAAPAPQVEETEAISQRGIVEVPALRDEYTKHFALPDGTYQAVFYGEAIHELDENGEWQEIDNSMYLNNVRGTELYSDAKGNAAFAKRLSLNKPVFSIANGGYGISMTIAPNSLSTQTMSAAETAPEAQVTNAAARRSTTYSTVEEAAEVDRSSTVRYANALPGVDLKYTVRNRNVKENIIVKARADSYSYRFALNLDGLYAQQEPDGSISLLDCNTHEREYVIPTGLMYDANETVSYDVAYTLTEEEGQYYLTVTADEDWINDPNRAMPVSIEQNTVNESAIYDTFVRDMFPDATHGSANKMWLADNSPTVGNAEAFIRGIMGDLPDNVTVLDASMRVYYFYNDNVTTGSFIIGAYPVYTYWSEYSATWRNTRNLQVSNSWIHIANADASRIATITNPKSISFSMTSLVQSWNNGNTNCGVKLKYVSGSSVSVCLHSSESGTAYSPRFFVTYEVDRLQDGVYSLTGAGNTKMAYFDNDTAGSEITQRTATENVTDEYLFKFTYLDTVDGEAYYTIRPMMNSLLTLSGPLSGGTVKAESIGIVDDWNSVAAEQRWAVGTLDGRYYIRNGTTGAGGYLAVPTSSNTTIDTDSLITTSMSGISSKWIISPGTTTTNTAFFTEYVTEIQLGEQTTYTFEAVPRSIKKGVNGPVSYSVVDENGKSTTRAGINSTTGVLTVHEPGVIKVGATFNGATETTWVTVYLYNSTVNIEFEYDNGYALRYSDPASRISNQAQKLRETLLNKFGLMIYWSEPTTFSSYADQCSTKGDECEEHCDHGDNMQCQNINFETKEGEYIDPDDYDYSSYTHHKNAYNILAAVRSSDSLDSYKVAYTGHVVCYCRRINGSMQHFGEGLFGLARVTSRKALICDRSESITHETMTLIHEFGHFLGAQDHYGPAESDTPTTDEMNAQVGGGNDYSERCIYGENKESITSLSDIPICDGCMSMIRDTIYGSD